MLRFFSNYKPFAIVLLVLSIVIISIFYQILKPREVLPIFQPAQVNAELVDSTIQHVKKYHTIADFSLINQNGKTVTQDTYNNKIYVADFFLYHLPNYLPYYDRPYGDTTKQIKTGSRCILLSHTVTPEIDSVAQLKKIRLKKGVLDSKWNLVTGDKKEIYQLSSKIIFSGKIKRQMEESMI